MQATSAKQSYRAGSAEAIEAKAKADRPDKADKAEETDDGRKTATKTTISRMRARENIDVGLLTHCTARRRATRQRAIRNRQYESVKQGCALGDEDRASIVLNTEY